MEAPEPMRDRHGPSYRPRRVSLGLGLGTPDQRWRAGHNLRCNLVLGAALGPVLDLDLAPVSLDKGNRTRLPNTSITTIPRIRKKASRLSGWMGPQMPLSKTKATGRTAAMAASQQALTSRLAGRKPLSIDKCAREKLRTAQVLWGRCYEEQGMLLAVGASYPLLCSRARPELASSC